MAWQRHVSQSIQLLYGCLQAEKGWPADPGLVLGTTAHHWQTRATAYARNSFLAAYSTFIDNTLVAVLQLLRVDDLFRRLTPWLEDSLAFLTRKLPTIQSLHSAFTPACAAPVCHGVAGSVIDLCGIAFLCSPCGEHTQGLAAEEPPPGMPVCAQSCLGLSFSSGWQDQPQERQEQFTTCRELALHSRWESHCLFLSQQCGFRLLHSRSV